jgi:hypothetical protein
MAEEDWIGAECPISGEPAKRLEKTTGDYEEYLTPSWGRFRISRTAVEVFKQYDQDAKIELLILAKRLADPEGELPFIKNVPDHP